MGHPRETNLPHDMGLPRPELAGREMGRVIYHMTWDFQGRNGTSKAGTGRLGGNILVSISVVPKNIKGYP